jgi:hypothetical protein
MTSTVLDATFDACGLSASGLLVIGLRAEPDRAELACRVVEPDRWCRRCGGQGVVRDSGLGRDSPSPPRPLQANATPLKRFVAGGPFAAASPAQLHEALFWSEQRTVTKTSTVRPHGNAFEVDATLVGPRRVRLRAVCYSKISRTARVSEDEVCAAAASYASL